MRCGLSLFVSEGNGNNSSTNLGIITNIKRTKRLCPSTTHHLDYISSPLAPLYVVDTSLINQNVSGQKVRIVLADKLLSTNTKLIL